MLQGFSDTLRCYLSLEKAVLSKYLKQHFGYYAVLLGLDDPNVDLSYLDNSPVLMKASLATQYRSDLNLDRGVVADLDAWPFLPDSLDMVISVRALSSVQNPKQVLEEAYQALRHDGVMLISELNPCRYFSKQYWKKNKLEPNASMLGFLKLKKLLESVGFEIILSENLGKWPIWSLGYVLLVKKKTIGLTPIKFYLKEKLLLPEVEIERI